MKVFTNYQRVTATEIRALFGEKTLTGVYGGNIVECDASLIEDSDVGVIVVRSSYDSFDRSTTAFLELDGCSFVIGNCQNTGFIGFCGETPTYTLVQKMNGKFYAEAYSIDINRAEKIGAFITKTLTKPGSQKNDR